MALYRTLLRIFKRPSLPKRLSPSFLAGVLSGLAFALHPADSRRVTITIYFLTRTLEFAYNVLDDKGYLPRNKPWWFGSWLIFPLSSAQLLHAFVFDRDCFPKVVPKKMSSNVGIRRFHLEIFKSIHFRKTSHPPTISPMARSLRNHRRPHTHLRIKLS